MLEFAGSSVCPFFVMKILSNDYIERHLGWFVSGLMPRKNQWTIHHSLRCSQCCASWSRILGEAQSACQNMQASHWCHWKCWISWLQSCQLYAWTYLSSTSALSSGVCWRQRCWVLGSCQICLQHWILLNEHWTPLLCPLPSSIMLNTCHFTSCKESNFWGLLQDHTSDCAEKGLEQQHSISAAW